MFKIRQISGHILPIAIQHCDKISARAQQTGPDRRTLSSTAMMPRQTSRISAVTAPEGLPARPSMAETLRATFGATGADNDIGARARARIDQAYSKFEVFGL